MDCHEPAPTPQRLLAPAGRGDQGAWRTLVETYSRRVYSLILRQCRDRDLAEEITQATFVTVVKRISRYREQGAFEAWLFQIAMNQLRDEMRRRKRQATAIGTTASSDGQEIENARATMGLNGKAVAGPFERVSRAEQLEHLRRQVAELPQADQEVLYLRNTAGLSYPQIAEVLGQPLGTVLARGHRVLSKLRKKMAQESERQTKPSAKTRP